MSHLPRRRRRFPAAWCSKVSVTGVLMSSRRVVALSGADGRNGKVYTDLNNEVCSEARRWRRLLRHAHRVLAKSQLIRMYALVLPRGSHGVCDCSRFLAGGVFSLSFRVQSGPIDTIFLHCRVCKCCVVASGLVMYSLCCSFVRCRGWGSHPPF